jgi:hypothetical protein
MKMTVGARRPWRLARCAAFLCALVASLSVLAAAAGAEPSEGPTPPVYDGDLSFGILHGPTDPDEFSWRVELGPDQALRQVSETEVEVDYAGTGHRAFEIDAIAAHAADGATVPTSLLLSEGDVITLTVHDRAGNPAEGGAPFAYPILPGVGWEGGFPTMTVVKGPPDEMEIEAERRAREGQETAPLTAPADEAAPTPICTVPPLHGLGLRGAKARLRARHCSVGQVHLARGATRGSGRVVKQFEPAGTVLAVGAPVAIKLAAR